MEGVISNTGSRKKGHVANFFTELKQATTAFIGSDPFGQAGAIAYSTVFALPAVLILTLVGASLFFDPVEVRRALFGQAGSFIGASSAAQLQTMVEQSRTEAATLFARVIGIVALLLSATSVFISVQTSLNRVWKVKPVPRRAIVGYFISRLMSLALMACFGFLLMVSLVLDTVMVALSERLQLWFSETSLAMVAGLNVLLSFGVIALVFALVFKLLPDAHIRWKDVRRGAILTAILFTLGKYLIGVYIGTSNVDDAYGAAGIVIIILIWVYFSSLILLFGANYTYQVAMISGGVAPSEHAEPIPEPQS